MHQGTMELREDKDRAPVIPEWAPYLKSASEVLKPKRYHVEVYGCQMNYNDTEILMSVLDAAGYVKVDSPKDANVIFLMTVGNANWSKSPLLLIQDTHPLLHPPCYISSVRYS